MPRMRSAFTNVIGALAIAMAVVGTVADALPCPLARAAGIGSGLGDGPFTPSREDERDETPDDATDLSWPELAVVSRGRIDRTTFRAARRLHLSPRILGRNRRVEGRNPQRSGGEVGLSIQLCRLTC